MEKFPIHFCLVYFCISRYLCVYLFNFILVIYRTQVIDETQTIRTCHIMSNVGKRAKKHAPVKEEKEIFECEVGKLRSPYCDVSCETVLGPKYKFCEEHRICENRKCSCAWGYTGVGCNTR
jgi:hypothetical protein